MKGEQSPGISTKVRGLFGGMAATVALVAGCAGGSGPNPPACTVSSVTVSANPAAINAGATTTLQATVSASSTCNGGVTWSATPAGGTLAPNGITATFTPSAAGTFAITATSTDDATRSGTATITVAVAVPPCGQPSGVVTTHSTNIATDESWPGDGVTHLIPISIAINGTATVTVQPCAIVALAQGVSITVRDNARLVSAGTSSSRFVTFRRNVASGAWGTLRGFHPTTLIDLRFTTLQGGGAFGGLSDPTIAVAGVGYGSPVTPVLRINNVTIQSSRGIGVHLDVNGGFTNDSQLLTVTGSGTRPIETTMMSLGTVPTGSYTGNGNDEILIIGPTQNVFADMTIQDLGVPVRIITGSMFVGPLAGATAPVTLTLKPGVVLKFPRLLAQAGARVTFGSNGNAPNNVVGVLNAIGTAAKPIVFTSGEAVPAPGDWVGLWLNTATGSRLDHVEISFAGAQTGIQSNNCRPINTRDDAALLVGSFSTQYVPPSNLITNSRITNSAGHAISAMWLAGAFNSPDLTATNIFQSVTRCRQTYNGLTPPGTCPLNGGCTAP